MFEMERSIRDIHIRILEEIPEHEVELIRALKAFNRNVQNLYEYQLKSTFWYLKYINTFYTNTFLGYNPKRPLNDFDREWLLNCSCILKNYSEFQK